MHDAAERWVADCVAVLELAESDVLDFGGRNVNGTVKHLFAGRTIAVDLADHPSVDVVGNAATVDLAQTFPVVVSTELLEHTPEGEAIVANAYRHLEPDGVFIATMAGPARAPHSATGAADIPADEWYRNVEPGELEAWLASAGFREWAVDVAGEDVRCWARR